MIIQAIMESLEKKGKDILGVRIAIWMCVFFAIVALIIALWINEP